MARKSKFFRVAVEGATTDGRKIERKWLQEIAETYNRDNYGARIFIEHIRGFNPNAENAFRAMGDVIAVKAEETDGKLALYAQIDPTEEMVELVNTKRQKIYSSIEVTENFAGTGKAYLMGLGITDSPASLGTDVLAFAAQNPAASPFATRKQSPENMFTAAELSEIEWEEEAPPASPTLLDRILAKFKRKAENDDARFSDVHAAVEEVAQVAGDTAAAAEQLRQDYSALRTQLEQSNAKHEKAISDLTATINHTPNNDPARPIAPGGTGAVTTDC